MNLFALSNIRDWLFLIRTAKFQSDFLFCRPLQSLTQWVGENAMAFHIFRGYSSRTMYSSAIVKLNHQHPQHRQAAARLHKTLLPESIVSQLGMNFMTGFYYFHLIKSGLIECHLYERDQQFVGFIVYTDYPFTFMGQGRKQFLWPLIVCLARALMANPARLKVLFQMMKNSEPRSHNPAKDSKDLGQFLSFGVLETYRRVKDEATGERISRVLMEKVFEHFREEGFKQFFLQVLKSSEAAIKLYKSYGGQIADNPEDPNGYLVTFDCIQGVGVEVG